MLASPVPSQMTFGSLGASSMSPMDAVISCSKTGVQVTPSFSVFHTPPVAVAAYIV